MDSQWYELRASAEKAVRKGNLGEASQFWLQALTLCNNLGKYDPQRITTLEGLAYVYWRSNQYSDALPILVKTFELHEDQLGPDHADIGVLANNLAMLYHTLEQFPQAEELYKRALRIRRKVLGVEHPEVVELIKNYSNLLVSCGRALEAEDLKASTVSVKTGVWNRSGHFKAIEIATPEALFEPESKPEDSTPVEERTITQAEAVDESAQISKWLTARKDSTAVPVAPPKWVELMAKGMDAVKQNNMLQAEQLLRQATVATEDFDETDPRIPSTLELFSEVLWNNGKLAEAQPICERTLRYYETTLEPKHQDIGVVSNNLAMLYHALDKHEEAEPLYKRAIDIRTANQGANHPEVITLLTNYANLLYVTQREIEAVNLKNYVRSVTSGKWNQCGKFKAMEPVDPDSLPVDQFRTFSKLKPDMDKADLFANVSAKISEPAEYAEQSIVGATAGSSEHSQIGATAGSSEHSQVAATAGSSEHSQVAAISESSEQSQVGTSSLYEMEPIKEDPRPVLDRMLDIFRKDSSD